jgi:hypothetical protein
LTVCRCVVSQVGARTSPVSRQSINLVLFATLFGAHFFTHAFYVALMNRIYNALYLSLIYGAACRLVRTLQ